MKFPKVPKAGFSATWIENLPRPAKRIALTEPGRPGFLLIVHPGGEKSFAARYKLNGKPAKLHLGNWPGTTLEVAHDEHTTIRKQLDRGIDPRAARDIERREHEVAKERAAIVEAGRKSYRDRYTEWFEGVIVKTRKRPLDVETKLGRNTLDRWGDRPVELITKADAIELLQSIVDRDAPAMANDVQEQLVQFFKWLAGRDYIPANPMNFVEMIGGEEYSRERWLSDDELRAFLGAMQSPEVGISRRVRLALLLVLVTAQRPGEIRAMRWDEIDFDKKVWTIPGDVVARRRSEVSGRKRNVIEWGKTKNGMPQVIPLSPFALALIEALRADVVEQYGEPQPYVVAAFKEANKLQPIEEKALARALRNCITVDKRTKAETLFGCETFTPQDLRRTATTLLGSLKIPPHIQSRVINHVSESARSKGDKSLGTYDRWEYLEEKRAAVDKLAARALSVSGRTQLKTFVTSIVDRERHAQQGIPKPPRRKKAA